jgi:DNA polymerase-3 subunit alpha
MSDNSDFVHLHAHGEYSMLDGVGTIEHVVGVAKERGFRAMAQTDHGNVSGGLKFANACKKAGIKPIIGCELYIVDDPSWRKPEGIKETEQRYHTIALAKDWDGFVSLMGLLTKAHSELGFYYKPRVSWSDLYSLKNCVVTSACVSGPFKHPNWEQKIKEYRDAFGDDFYIEVQPHNFDKQYIMNRRAVEMSLNTGAKLLATNDFHYANEEDCHAQDTLLGLRDKKTISSEEKWEMTDGLYMKTYDQMLNSFHVLNGNQDGSVITEDLAKWAMLNSVEVAEKCNFKMPKLDVDLPDVDTSELGTLDPDVALMELCAQGWKRRFEFSENSEPAKPYIARLLKEMEIIQRLKFSKYFLLVWDIYRFCNKNNIFYGPGRGSGAGSLVCYLLGITNADPLVYGLIFERFINPERIDLPDLDLDFEHERRDEIYRYIHNTYKHVAHIATYGGMNVKMVLKDVGRFREVNLDDVNLVNQEIEFNTGKQDKAKLTLKDVEADPKKYPAFAEFAAKNPAVVTIAKVLEGQVRQTGIHAGGVIVARHPLEERAVVEWRKGEPTINFDMYDVGDLALLKVDVLGSKTVSVLKYSKRLIDEQYQAEGMTLSLDSIPLDDKNTLNQFDIGQTTGIFQFESDGMRKMLKEMAPHDIHTVITANAMYRPGPLQFKDTYVKQKKNPKLIKSTGNIALDKITHDTYGVFIYQEQVMQIAVEVAGFTYPESDALRKKISKSKGKDEIEKDREKFVGGCVSFGKLSLDDANHLFDSIVDFGRYCFNKSHATTYSLVSYYAMWLRTHFSCEFLTASIAYAGDTPKAKEERASLKKEAKRLGIDYMPPHINFSQPMCSMEFYGEDGKKKRLRGGFNEIDGIGNAATEVIMKARAEGSFLSWQNFLDRLENKRVVNVGVQEKILQADLFAGVHDAKTVRMFIDGLRTKKQPSPVAKLNQEMAKKQEDIGTSLALWD